MSGGKSTLCRKLGLHRWTGPRWRTVDATGHVFMFPIFEYWQTCERCGLHREKTNIRGPFISDRDHWVTW